ncbi:hypothetical protein FRC00_005349 [Tulasnella sp. 408]|nr:hypothetical protein FRC00_005349 [Tulasnella sp. 408]
MIFRTQWRDEEWDDPNYRLQNEFLRTLFAAYRQKDERIMFRKISVALASDGDERREWPDHEIFVWLFELCLLPGRSEIHEFHQHQALEHVDHHLLSLENRIREESASEIDRQRGRDYQNRYVQSIVGFCAGQDYYSQKTWCLISTPMERYLKSVKQLMESHSMHPENSGTMDLLLRMESAFAEPQPVGASASGTNHERTIASSTFRRLLDEIGLSVPAKALVSTEVNGLQVATGHDDGKRVRLPVSLALTTIITRAA